MGKIFNGKRAQQVKGGVIILLAVLGILAFKPEVFSGILGKQAATDSGQGTTGSGGSLGTVEVVGKCGQSVTLTSDMVERYSESTSMSTQNVTIVVNGAEISTRADGGTETVKEGDVVELYYSLDPAGNTYAASYAKGTIPNCAPAVKTSDNSIFSPVDAWKLYRQSTQPTVTILNDDSTTQPTAQALGVGQTRHMTMKFYPAYEQGYGTADGSTLACRFTDSQIDQAGTTISLDGAPLADAKYVPSQTIFSVTATNQSTKYWHVPAIDGKAKTIMEFDLGLKGDDTNEPVAATNFSCVFLDTDYYKTDSGQYKIDVEDRDDNTGIGRATDFGVNILLS